MSTTQDGVLAKIPSMSVGRLFALAVAFVRYPALHPSFKMRYLTHHQFIGRFFIRAVQRVYFHPLSKFPGPKLHAATRIPSIIERWKGVQHLRLAELHCKYGPVVRVNHDELSFTDPNAWKDVGILPGLPFDDENGSVLEAFRSHEPLGIILEAPSLT